MYGFRILRLSSTQKAELSEIETSLKTDVVTDHKAPVAITCILTACKLQRTKPNRTRSNWGRKRSDPPPAWRVGVELGVSETGTNPTGAGRLGRYRYRRRVHVQHRSQLAPELVKAAQYAGTAARIGCKWGNINSAARSRSICDDGSVGRASRGVSRAATRRTRTLMKPESRTSSSAPNELRSRVLRVAGDRRLAPSTAGPKINDCAPGSLRRCAPPRRCHLLGEALSFSERAMNRLRSRSVRSS